MNQEYRQHDRAFYCDGNKRVDYCRVCGAEGLELNGECSGEFREQSVIAEKEHQIIKKNNRKIIDIDTEPY